MPNALIIVLAVPRVPLLETEFGPVSPRDCNGSSSLPLGPDEFHWCMNPLQLCLFCVCWANLYCKWKAGKILHVSRVLDSHSCGDRSTDKVSTETCLSEMLETMKTWAVWFLHDSTSQGSHFRSHVAEKWRAIPSPRQLLECLMFFCYFTHTWAKQPLVQSWLATPPQALTRGRASWKRAKRQNLLLSPFPELDLAPGARCGGKRQIAAEPETVHLELSPAQSRVHCDRGSQSSETGWRWGLKRYSVLGSTQARSKCWGIKTEKHQLTTQDWLSEHHPSNYQRSESLGNRIYTLQKCDRKRNSCYRYRKHWTQRKFSGSE